MRTLLNNERIIVKAENDKVVLTNKRIWKEDIGGGKAFYQSIMLNHVNSIQSTIEHYLILLVMGGLLAAFAVYATVIGNSPEMSGASAIGAAVCFICYLMMRSSTITIASSSVKIKLSINSAKKEKILEFIDRIESAIDDYQKSFFQTREEIIQ